jgi:hypothetical protein
LFRPRLEILEDRFTPSIDIGFLVVNGTITAAVGGQDQVFAERPTTSMAWARWSAEDGMGNIFVVGEAGGWVDFDPGPGVVLSADQAGPHFLAKYTSDGRLLWARSFVPWFDGLSTDAKGNVYLTGYLNYYEMDFDPAPNVYETVPGSVITLPPPGLRSTDPAWVGPPEIVYVGTVSPPTKVLVGGYFFLRTSTDLSERFLLKLDGDGNFVWARKVSGDGSLSGFIVSGQGNGDTGGNGGLPTSRPGDVAATTISPPELFSSSATDPVVAATPADSLGASVAPILLGVAPPSAPVSVSSSSPTTGDDSIWVDLGQNLDIAGTSMANEGSVAGHRFESALSEDTHLGDWTHGLELGAFALPDLSGLR